MKGVTVEIWHHGKDEFDEVRWLPNLDLKRSHAKALAYRILMEDGFSTQVRVIFGSALVEEAARSPRRAERIKVQWEKAHLAVA